MSRSSCAGDTCTIYGLAHRMSEDIRLNGHDGDLKMVNMDHALHSPIGAILLCKESSTKYFACSFQSVHQLWSD